MVIRTQAAQEIPVSIMQALSAVHDIQFRTLDISDPFLGIVFEPSDLDLKRAPETVSNVSIFLEILMESRWVCSPATRRS